MSDKVQEGREPACEAVFRNHAIRLTYRYPERDVTEVYERAADESSQDFYTRIDNLRLTARREGVTVIQTPVCQVKPVTPDIDVFCFDGVLTAYCEPSDVPPRRDDRVLVYVKDYLDKNIVFEIKKKR